MTNTNIHKQPNLPSLLLCIIMDVIGMASYAFPAIAEIFDVVWAPISAYVFLKLFGGKVGKIGAIINFLEEIIPFTDIIPSFTIAWFIRRKEITQLITK